MTNCRFAAVAGLLAFSASVAFAQTAPNMPVVGAKPAASSDAQKAAFLGLPEADRKAAQDALVWLGLYNGVVDGGFGKRTLDAILAFQASLKAPADGIVSADQLAALKSAAQKARAAVAFQTFDDPATGIRIAAPSKLLDKRAGEPGHSRISSRDNYLSLDLVALSSSDVSLEGLYRKLIADAPGRKVAYKAIKPDAFFVVSGEEFGRKYYLRYAVAPPGASEPGAIRGFSFAYPSGRAADLDRIALAVANSFEPFPTAPPAQAQIAPPIPAAPPTPAPAPTRSPSGPVLTATALVVAQGQALTALKESDCPKPMLGGKPAHFLRADASTGLALLGGEFEAPPAALRPSSELTRALVLSLAGANAPVLEAAEASLTPIAADRLSAVVSIDESARGAPLFDGQGGLVAILAATGGPPRRLGVVVLAEPHEAIGSGALKAFLGPAATAAASPAGAIGAAEIARQMRAAILPVYCAS